MFKRILCSLLLLAAVSQAETLEQAVDGYLVAAEAGKKPSKWTITGSLGLTVTDGNSDTITLSVGVDASREFGVWKLILAERSIYTESSSVATANEHIFTERLERQLTEKSWLFQDFLLEYDEFEDLDYRLIFTLGYKRLLIKKEKFELVFDVGGGVRHDEYSMTSSTEGIAQIGIYITWQITKQLLFTQTFKIYPSLSDGGEFLFISESVFTTPVGERLNLRLAIIDQYNSSPVGGRKENDLKFVLALVIKFTKEEA